MVLRPRRGPKAPTSPCAGRSCTPPPGPALPRSRGPGNSTAPARTWTGSPAAWAAGTTPTKPPVRNRLAVIGKTRRVADHLTTATGTDPSTGKPTLQWAYDQVALEAESATDGWYALLTNLDPAEADTPGVLLRFKGKEASERRYGNCKGPLAVAPMFLQHNRRIATLITVICLALLVFSLVERQVRAQIAPAAKIPGLYADRPARPTGWLIFAAMAGLRLIPAAADRPAVIPRPTPPQQRLLDLLDVDPLRPP